MAEDTTLRLTQARAARCLLLARGDTTGANGTRGTVLVSREALAMMLGVT